MAGTREQTIPMREPQAILSNARSPQEFEALIQGAWQKETGRILEVGKLLLQAREQLLPAVFKGLRLPFKARMAQMLAKSGEPGSGGPGEPWFAAAMLAHSV